MISDATTEKSAAGLRSEDAAPPTERRPYAPSGGAPEILRRVDEALVRMYGPKSLKPSREPVGELIHIILTQNTSDVNSDRTYAALRRAYDSWGGCGGCVGAGDCRCHPNRGGLRISRLRA